MPTGDSDTMWASISETVIPDSSVARRCLRSTILGARPAPTATPITRASRATTAVSSSAVTTLTSKWYETGERHPSSVRLKRDMSHRQAQVFGWRSSSVCPKRPVARLLRPLSRNCGRTRGGGLGVQVGPARDLTAQIAVEVVSQRDAGRDVQPDHV